MGGHGRCRRRRRRRGLPGGLAEVLGEVAAESDKHRRRLFSLEADVEAFRRVIGTAPAEVTP
ncbi:hypothetical protein JCM10369A_33430 [Nocardioides pyridinolyticus]